MKFKPDLIEEQISSVDKAWELLNNELSEFTEIFNIWSSWFNEIVKDVEVQEVVTDTVVISYARMAKRNGTLSENPRAYHSEKHIDDLLYRLIAISKLEQSKSITDYGWSLLSLFMCTHDLRQTEINDDLELVGNNEQASFQEAVRILIMVDKYKIARPEHKELLRLMIHGSTFGRGEDTHGNIYIGNLVEYLLERVRYFDDEDKELAYLSCDLDTANVAADLKDYANSSVNVYNEINNILPTGISAQDFFGKQQEQYFFVLQKFNSNIGYIAFAKLKEKNAPKIKQICVDIESLDKNMSNEDVVKHYLSLIDSYT